MTRRGTGPRRSATTERAVQGLLGSGAVAVAVLLLLSAPAVGSGIVVMTAPYSGVVTTSSTSVSSTSCSHASVLKAGFFKANSGKGGFVARSSAAVCGSTPSPGATASTGFTSAIPIALAHASDRVAVVMHYRAWLSTHITVAPCVHGSGNLTLCAESAYSEVYASVYLIDTTTGSSYWYPTNYWSGVYQSLYSDQYCYASNCSTYSYNTTGPSQQSGTVTWWINATSATPADKFALIASFSAYTGAYDYAYGATSAGATATAYVNAASLGEGMFISSISIA